MANLLAIFLFRVSSFVTMQGDSMTRAAQTQFESTIENEITASEVKRVTILCVLIAIFFCLAAVVRVVFADELAAIPADKRPDFGLILLTLVGAFAYEWVARFAFRRFHRLNKPLPFLARYGNATIETSL